MDEHAAAVAVYVETDFIVALARERDWLQNAALTALDSDDQMHTSILAYAELRVLFYDREASDCEIDALRAITNPLELVPIRPRTHEAAVLAAAAFLEEHDATPLDALHAGIVTTGDGRVRSPGEVYDVLGLDRTPLTPPDRR